MRRLLLLLCMILLLVIPALAEDAAVQDCAAVLGQPLQLRYTVPETGAGSLTLTDAEGHPLRELLSQRTMIGGKHALNLEASFLHGLQADTCGNPGCYWCTPMDITDEAAVWAMLTSPMTVIDAKQKEQVLLYAQPDAGSEAIAVITGASQGVHVLEDLDNGWTKVETYSSSFHDSKVKNWNAFVTGYIQSSKLKQTPVNQDYGIVIDKLTQRLYLFHEGKLMTELLCSTGLYNERQPYNETRSGEFMIVSRVGDFKSDNLVCAIGLRFNSGDLLHEVPHTLNADGSKNYKNCESKLGTRASHGCIRVQRLRNADGINMRWIWDNVKNGTKLVVWEDYQGRQITPPADSTPVYYNPKGGANYHRCATCYGVKDQYLPLTAFAYGELDSGEYAALTPCPYCCPPRRKAEIAAINEEHLKSSPGEIMAIIGQ